MKVLENYSHEVPISGCVRITSNLLVDVQKSHSSKIEHLSRTKCVNKVQYLLSRGESRREGKREKERIPIAQYAIMSGTELPSTYSLLKWKR
jgi:hypothetical protein